MSNVKKKSFLSLFEECNQEISDYEQIEDQSLLDEEGFLTEELDHEILMHRDVHFYGDFDVMLAYYQNEENLGIDPDFEKERIEYLYRIEKSTTCNLGAYLLSSAEMERVAYFRNIYLKFKEIYEIENEKNPFPRLFANLVLSEKKSPKQEIDAIVKQGGALNIVEELLQIIQFEDAYNSLFPGFGYAPYFAILCLGKIQDPRAIIPLFEILGKEMTFDESVILEALKSIGHEACEFLLKIVSSRPITKDNEQAALALSIFADDSRVATVCYDELKDSIVRGDQLLTFYLLANCETLKSTPLREEFFRMKDEPTFSKDVREEIKRIVRDWH